GATHITIEIDDQNAGTGNLFGRDKKSQSAGRGRRRTGLENSPDVYRAFHRGPFRNAIFPGEEGSAADARASAGADREERVRATGRAADAELHDRYTGR